MANTCAVQHFNRKAAAKTGVYTSTRISVTVFMTRYNILKKINIKWTRLSFD